MLVEGSGQNELPGKMGNHTEGDKLPRRLRKKIISSLSSYRKEWAGYDAEKDKQYDAPCQPLPNQRSLNDILGSLTNLARISGIWLQPHTRSNNQIEIPQHPALFRSTRVQREMGAAWKQLPICRATKDEVKKRRKRAQEQREKRVIRYLSSMGG